MGELKQGSEPHIGAVVWARGETFKAESETADLWQPKWNENQTVLAAAIHTPDRDADPLEGAVAGSWSLGIVEQSQGEGWCWLQRVGLRRCEEGDCGGKCLWRKAGEPWKQGDTAESWVVGVAITTASLSPRPHWQLNSREADPSNAWCTELQSKPSPGRLLYVADAPNNGEEPQAREPSKCLNGQSSGETGQRGLLIASYKRLKKKILIEP